MVIKACRFNPVRGSPFEVIEAKLLLELLMCRVETHKIHHKTAATKQMDAMKFRASQS
jgi:hypothetical protein